MANGKTLRQLLKAGTSGNPDEFLRASELIICEERQKQHHLLANELEQIIYSTDFSPSKRSTSKLYSDVPKDKDKGLPLLDIKFSKRSIEEVILPRKSHLAIEELIDEHRRNDVLKTYGMKASNKIIFFGPPGCGKTLTAEVIACELNLPLAILRIDTIVSSYLGETSSNLRMIFDYISAYPMVVLFDEFDAIGKDRGDIGEHGEMRRVVNSILQMMDSYNGNSLIIAATNHEQILDYAIWRRFDEVIEFPKPTKNIILEILKLKLRGIRFNFELNSANVMNFFEGLNGADIDRVAIRAVKRVILSKREYLTITDLKQSIAREIRKHK